MTSPYFVSPLCEPGHSAELAFLVFAGCGVCKRHFAGIANIGDVSFHADFNAAFAGFRVCAKLFHVSRTGLGSYNLEHHRLAGLGQVLEVRLDAVPDPASARLHPCALRLDITRASARYFCRCQGTWEQQHGDAKKKESS